MGLNTTSGTSVQGWQEIWSQAANGGAVGSIYLQCGTDTATPMDSLIGHWCTEVKTEWVTGGDLDDWLQMRHGTLFGSGVWIYGLLDNYAYSLSGPQAGGSMRMRVKWTRAGIPWVAHVY